MDQFSAVKKPAGLSACKPKPLANVKITWTTEQLKEQALFDLHGYSFDTLEDFAIKSQRGDFLVEPSRLEEVFKLVFKYTLGIESASLLSSSFELRREYLQRHANLSEFNSGQGTFKIQVPIHPHVFAHLWIKLTPLHAFLTAKNDICDSMVDIQKYLWTVLEEKPESHENTREQRQLASIRSLLAQFPRVTPTQQLMLGVQGMRDAFKKKATLAVAVTVLKRHLLKLSPATFPSGKKFEEVLTQATQDNLIEFTIGKKNMLLKSSGMEFIESMLKK